jgi:hypothetical protein
MEILITVTSYGVGVVSGVFAEKQKGLCRGVRGVDSVGLTWISPLPETPGKWDSA